MSNHSIVWATDHVYAPHAAASIHSVLSHDPNVVAHVLTAPSVSGRDRRRFAALGANFRGRIELIPFNEELVRGLPTISGIPSVMWYRIHLPELLATTSRALYLDADTIACRSVGELFDLDLGTALVGAVDNVTEPGARDFERELGLPQGQSYFNSGVLLLDLDAMREAETTRTLLQTASRPLVWPDQDALNIALGGRRRHLHPRWNTQNSLYGWAAWAHDVFGPDAAEAVADPAILHFEGHGSGTKPWDDRCAHPLRSAYLEHAAATPWPLRSDTEQRTRRRLKRVARSLSTAVSGVAARRSSSSR